MTLPDLRNYRLHRVVAEATFEGTAVPGLRAEFFRRAEGERTASVGRYFYGGRPVVLGWGWTDEEHCRYSAVRDISNISDRWRTVGAGCPRVRILRGAAGVDGIKFGDGAGGWLVCRDGDVSSVR